MSLEGATLSCGAEMVVRQRIGSSTAKGKHCWLSLSLRSAADNLMEEGTGDTVSLKHSMRRMEVPQLWVSYGCYGDEEDNLSGIKA